jgi:hypothetical protein
MMSNHASLYWVRCNCLELCLDGLRMDENWRWDSDELRRELLHGFGVKLGFKVLMAYIASFRFLRGRRYRVNGFARLLA